MKLPLIDFHCHLDLYPNFEAAIAECERREIFTLAVTTTPKAWPRNQQLVSRTKHIRAALGLHPQLVAERANELRLWEEYLPQARYVGEVGLDAGPKFFSSIELQKKIFERILRACARHGNKILTVHSVRATKLVLDMIEMYLPVSQSRVVLHWFTGTQSEAKRAIDLGCYFSLNAEMTNNPRRVDLIAGLPLNRILTETDGPFTKTGEQVAQPKDVQLLIDALAHIRKSSPEKIAQQVFGNLRELVSDDLTNLTAKQ